VTREEAALAAIDANNADEGGERWVAPYRYPEASDYVCDAIDMDDFLERLEEAAADDGCYGGDDALFEPIDPKAAKAALEELLKRWADEHLDTMSYSVDSDQAEKVRG
jgi:hypothetical protein